MSLPAPTDHVPAVTIGMPLYNADEPHLRRALDTLLAQDFEDFELLISDNASTNGTLDVCREHAARDPRIRILPPNGENIGIVANFRRLLFAARSDYFLSAACDSRLYERALFLRDHGRQPSDFSYWNTTTAYKYKMSNLQAALGLVQVERAEELVAIKRRMFGWFARGWPASRG